MTQYSGKIIRKNPVTPTQKSASGVWKLNEQAAAIKNNTWPIAGVPDPISRSVRLRSSASAYFNRTPASTSNTKTWTWSGWIKRGGLASGTYYEIFGAAATSGTVIYFVNDNFLFQLTDAAGTTIGNISTTAVFRDPSAWYHVVAVLDTTQATGTNRCKVYINGVQQTLTFTTTPSQNADARINNSSFAHSIGGRSTLYFDGYLTEINFIDGQALTPSSFGTTDAATGAWIPMAYTGTYGTNGFYLNFSDNTSTTTIGYDYSGNSNNWAANNISLTAGTTYDSMLDNPTQWVGYTATTDTSAVTRGNYAVLSPIDTVGTPGSITAGNLNLTGGSAAWYESRSGFGLTSGKWYWEINIVSTNVASNGCNLGIASSAAQGSGYSGANKWTYNNNSGGRKALNTVSSAYGVAYVTNDVVGVAFDADAGTLVFYVNNSSQGTAASSGLPNPAFPCVECYGTDTVAANFGQRPFTYTPPTGFKALCTTNLSAPTISNGANYMAASLYTGTLLSNSIVNSGNNAASISFQPDLVWVKSRSAATDHKLTDSVRGVTKALISDTTGAETTDSQGLTVLNSNGFTVGTDTVYNNLTATYVAWQWKANGAAVSNTNGSITSQVSANTTAGFSVVTYTGNGTGGATVGHGLNISPSMYIVKGRNTTAGQSWRVYQKYANASPASGVLNLNTTDGFVSSSTQWNNTAPTSSVFSIGTDPAVNESTKNYVAYCWSEIAGYSKFGSYTGNGSADGTFVYCGFRPRWVMVKCSSNASTNWVVIDTSRDTYNLAGQSLEPNLNAAEYTPASSGYPVDILSNGFKWRDSGSQSDNYSGYTYIFAAFAENPFKYSNAR